MRVRWQLLCAPVVGACGALGVLSSQSTIAAVATMALGLSFLITLVPARNAARLNPVEALRNE